MPDLDAELRRMQRTFTPGYYRADLGPGNHPPAHYCLTEAVARTVFPSWPYGAVRLRVMDEDDAVDPAPSRRRGLFGGIDRGAVGCAVVGFTVATVVQGFTGSAGWGDVAGLPVVVVGVFGLFWWRRRGGRRG